MPENNPQILIELQAMREKADQKVTSHSFLRDFYQGWGQRLNIYVLLGTALLLFLTLASADFLQRTLGITPDEYKWSTGVTALLAFCLSLVDLTWNPGTKSKAHDQAVAHYLRMGYEIRNLLVSGDVSKDKVRILQEEYLDAADLPRIPEDQSLTLKRRHLQKMAVAKALELNPHQSLWWLGVRLWWRGSSRLEPRPVAAAMPAAAK
jgi:hypothetical protein